VEFGPEPSGILDADEAPYATAAAFLVGIEAGHQPRAVVAGLTGYPKDLLDRVLRTYVAARVRKPRLVTGSELMVGMVVDQDVMTANGLVLLRAGELLTESMAIRLRHFADGVGLIEPIAVLV